MSKINILKSKGNGKRVGEFSLRRRHSIKLHVNFQRLPGFQEEFLGLLHKYFDIITLSQNSNRRGRGSLARTTSYQRRKENEKKKSEK